MISSTASPAQSLDCKMGPKQQASATEPRESLPSSFEQLFLEKYSRIIAVLFRLVGDRTRAEELASDVFLKLYRQPLPPREDGNPGGWLYRTAMNLGIDALRANARRKQFEEAASRRMLEARAPADPLDEVLRAERRDHVRAALASLRPAQAQILVLRHSGFSYKEVAEILGVQRGSVGTMLARAEAEFEARYRELFGSEEGL